MWWQAQGFSEVLTGIVWENGQRQLALLKLSWMQIFEETEMEAFCVTGLLGLLVLPSLVPGPFFLKTHKLLKVICISALSLVWMCCVQELAKDDFLLYVWADKRYLSTSLVHLGCIVKPKYKSPSMPYERMTCDHKSWGLFSQQHLSCLISLRGLSM